MEQKTIAEVAKSAEVFSGTTEAASAQRRQRLERLADLLDAYHGRVQLFSRIEYVRSPARLLMRADNSPLAVAFADPVFRVQGLAGDRLGDAMEFFALREGQAHALFCDCHYTSAPSARTIAGQVRALARRPTLRDICERAGRAISRLWR
jgi:hypothetical protein